MAKHSDYLKIYIAHMDKFCRLEKKRDETTKEMRRVHQMAKAALAMMPDAERKIMQARFREWELPTEGLTAAIRNVLFERFEQGLGQSKRGDVWMTAAQIKEALERAGYDFTKYRSNPLISVHGILKRLERKEVNFREMPGGSRVYRISYQAAAKRLTAPAKDNPINMDEIFNQIEEQSGIRIQRMKKDKADEGSA